VGKGFLERTLGLKTNFSLTKHIGLEMKIRLPSSTQNWVSLIGATIALISLFLIVFLFALSLLFGQGGLYLGLVTYILLPTVLIFGLLLIPVGMIIRTIQMRGKEKVKSAWPMINLEDPKHRNAFFIFSIGTTIFLFLSAIGNYEAFHYTETVQFCGTLCHKIMHPEYTAYQHSPHAKVPCVSCHVGPGANWFVRSKLSGLHQVYAAVTKTYPRPISTPIKNLRPARVVCEQCHWPQKFYSRTLRLETHYLPDEKNTRWDIRLIMKIGAQNSAHGLREGIHWHINPNVKIQYIATDHKRTDIPWVRYINSETGDTIVYENPENSLTQDQLDTLNIRTMDCIDCHTRPSHDYQSPSHLLNTAMASGKISPDLPNIKSVALVLFDTDFSSTDMMIQTIQTKLTSYYSENYPKIFESKKSQLDTAIQTIQKISARNIFPDMKVRWDTHVNNIAHLEFKGCFRCHNGKHVSSRGNIIPRKCDLCHLINAQGLPGKMESSQIDHSLEFRHPVDIDDAWKEMLCSDCHTGLNP